MTYWPDPPPNGPDVDEDEYQLWCSAWDFDPDDETSEDAYREHLEEVLREEAEEARAERRAEARMSRWD